ncbi:MAG: hypothetical protein GY915_02415, partial [bacterium]|nr:hypothetical protein [bacterium]
MKKALLNSTVKWIWISLVFQSASLLWAGNSFLQPSAWGKEAGVYEVRTLLGVNEIPGKQEKQFPLNTSFDYGFLSRGEVGVTYGDAVSIQASGALTQETDVIPAMRFGFRSLMFSPES